ncbi:hypothetical protein SAY87_004033 [Trapa incisa]|uniref:Protein kinase domain-containing protein n=1 Tax=Trapa incisa TaxID=236973 RepID=A0AAN7JN45_9MYRT|nr:hypothetical protein SAY87_004033 [Trapa incisa]
MAPEYVIHGKLTEKAGVYSFGVLVLEIVCGPKNSTFMGGHCRSLLQMVWKLYKLNSLSEAVDASLEGDCPREEATHVLKIGLLCTQASAGDRPTMHQVLEMLMYSSSKIPEPNQPPFLNARAMDLQSTSRSHSTNN